LGVASDELYENNPITFINFIFVGNAAEIPSSFSKAKKLALTQVYKGHQKSFYCGCSFIKKKQVNQARCSYEPRMSITRTGKNISVIIE